jgi:hypothetical protein
VVQEALDRAAVGRSTLIIAHRFVTHFSGATSWLGATFELWAVSDARVVVIDRLARFFGSAGETTISRAIFCGIVDVF